MAAVLPACVLLDSAPQGHEPPDEPLAPASTGPTTTRVHLGTPQRFKVKAGGRADVTARRTFGDEIQETADLPVMEGSITMHARPDGRIVVDTLKLSLGDIHLSEKSVPPAGLDLMGVSLRMENEMTEEASWTDDDSAAAASGDVRFLLDWSLKGLGGELFPLATQRIEAVPLQLDVRPDRAGGLTVIITAERDGVFWDWTGLMELSDLHLDVEAAL